MIPHHYTSLVLLLLGTKTPQLATAFTFVGRHVASNTQLHYNNNNNNIQCRHSPVSLSSSNDNGDKISSIAPTNSTTYTTDSKSILDIPPPLSPSTPTEQQQQQQLILDIPPPLPPPPSSTTEDTTHWLIGPTFQNPQTQPLPPSLLSSLLTSTHPPLDDPLLAPGTGIYILDDWRRAWYTYESHIDHPDTIRPSDGFAEYVLDDIEGILPEDLVGTMYRNGPGQMGVNGERVEHVLDGDGLILQFIFPPPSSDKKREITFRSRFVQTKHFLMEQAAGDILARGTFGTAPRGPLSPTPLRRGLNADPTPLGGTVAKITANAFQTDIKNAANTQVVSFGGKVLALFEAGLPYRIDPTTLETMGTDDLGGALRDGLPVTLDGLPRELMPDFLDGTAHTAHPQRCPASRRMVGWHWKQVPDAKALEVTISEWSPDDFSLVASATHRISNCELAPHDMIMTEDVVVMLINSFEMDQAAFLTGVKGPAASLKMDGRATTRAMIFPRPTSMKKFEPMEIEVPPHFSIHFSHAYQESAGPNDDRLVTYFSGWPPSDATDFLGAWGGFAPSYDVIPPTFLWRLELDLVNRKTVSLRVAPGAGNVNIEMPVVHPEFTMKKAKYVYGEVANVVGDASTPMGYGRLRVDSGEEEDDREWKMGEINSDAEVYFFGPRYSAGEPLIVPKDGANRDDETQAYLLGMVYDAAKRKSFVAVFDLEKDMREGPVCRLYCKSAVPHGLHGCFAVDDKGGESVFC